MELVRFLSPEEKEALEEGRTLTETRNWGDYFEGTTSFGKCFLEGNATHVKPNQAIGIMRRDRFLSFLSSDKCDYDFALVVEGSEEDILSVFELKKGTYPNNISMDEWCIRSLSIADLSGHGLSARFVPIPHFESGY